MKIENRVFTEEAIEYYNSTIAKIEDQLKKGECSLNEAVTLKKDAEKYAKKLDWIFIKSFAVETYTFPERYNKIAKYCKIFKPKKIAISERMSNDANFILQMLKEAPKTMLNSEFKIGENICKNSDAFNAIVKEYFTQSAIKQSEDKGSVFHVNENIATNIIKSFMTDHLTPETRKYVFDNCYFLCMKVPFVNWVKLAYIYSFTKEEKYEQISKEHEFSEKLSFTKVKNVGIENYVDTINKIPTNEIIRIVKTNFYDSLNLLPYDTKDINKIYLEAVKNDGFAALKFANPEMLVKDIELIINAYKKDGAYEMAKFLKHGIKSGERIAESLNMEPVCSEDSGDYVKEELLDDPIISSVLKTETLLQLVKEKRDENLQSWQIAENLESYVNVENDPNLNLNEGCCNKILRKSCLDRFVIKR